MREPDNVSWNTIISAFAQNGDSGKALELLSRMLLEGFLPDGKTFVRALGAATSLRSLRHDAMVVNSLINLYGKLGEVEQAESLLRAMPHRTVGSWNAVIGAFAQIGQLQKALELLSQMDTQPNHVTFICVLASCANSGDLERGRRVHKQVTAEGLDTEVLTGNSLVNMYAKAGAMKDAREAFERISSKSPISWSTLVSGYVRNGYCKKPVALFRRMSLEGVKQDMGILTSVLEACSMLRDLELGKRIHSQAVATATGTDEVFVTALINFYANCGRLEEARRAFESVRYSRDVICWNAMLAAYSQLGRSTEALCLFQELCLEGVAPDDATFVTIVSACSHGGFFVEGCSYFMSMSSDFGMQPSDKHCRCISDLLGRAGNLKRAEEMLEAVPSSRLAWASLLAASQLQIAPACALRAAARVSDIDPGSSYAYFVALLSTIPKQ